MTIDVICQRCRQTTPVDEWVASAEMMTTVCTHCHKPFLIKNQTTLLFNQAERFWIRTHGGKRKIPPVAQNTVYSYQHYKFCQSLFKPLIKIYKKIFS